MTIKKFKYYCKKKLFKFNGRVGRKKYALFFIPLSIFATLVCWLHGNNDFSIIVSMIVYVSFFQLIAVTSRRLHDLGVSGFWQILLFLIPPSLISLCFFKGEAKSNKYGEPPLD